MGLGLGVAVGVGDNLGVEVGRGVGVWSGSLVGLGVDSEVGSGVVVGVGSGVGAEEERREKARAPTINKLMMIKKMTPIMGKKYQRCWYLDRNDSRLEKRFAMIT